MRFFIIFVFALFITVTSFAQNLAQSTKLKEGLVIQQGDYADFKKLSALIQKFAMGGFPCIQKKIAKLKQSKSEAEIKSMSAKEQKKLQDEFTKECMCSSEAKKTFNEINNLLNKHSDWIGKTITHKKQGNSSDSLDMKSMKMVIDSFSKTCGK